MNEYAGFRVGDKVKISIVDCAPITGIITSFGDRKVGGIAEFDTLDVWIDKTAKFDMLYLRRHDQIEKLPKYAVGDRVRARNSIFTVQYYSPFEKCYYFGDSLPRLQEHNIMPFDGFRVGDTVYTIKRGKGKIVSEIVYKIKVNRRFFVRFEGMKLDVNPKLSNLLTEAEYKAKTDFDKKYYFYVNKLIGTLPFEDAPTPNNPYFGKIQVAGCEEIKVNDAVLYRGKKWMVENINVDYVLRRSDHMGGYRAFVSREDISLWKEPIPKNLAWYTDYQKKHDTLYGYMLIEEGGVMKHKSKFGVGQLVSYAGCIRAVVDKIHLNDGKFTYDLRTNECPSGVPEYSLTAVKPCEHLMDAFRYATPVLDTHNAAPKLKVDDAVLYKGEKWEVVGWYTNTNSKDIDYCISRGLDHLNVKESDLRLWKDTKITHIDNADPISSYGNINNDKGAMSKLKYIGKHLDGKDMFLQDAGNGKSVLWYGEKGDDIQ